MLRRWLPLFVAAAILCGAAAALATDQPRIIARSKHIDRSISEVYATLKNYFSDESLSLFQLKSADPKTFTIVATRSGIDGEHWRKWAFCPTSGVHMLYQLNDGSVTLTVTLERSGNTGTFATVSADFQGGYNLGANQQKIACESKGALEDDIFSVAAAGASKK
jgi:hypothetical protein